MARSRATAPRRAVGQVFNTLLTALCYSYFRHIHRRHHPHCNERTRDPDMQSEFFSMYPESAREKRGLGRLISRHQAALIWILVWLQGLTLKIDSLRFLYGNARATRVDQALVLLHLMLWFVPPVLLLGFPAALLNYALMTLLIGPYLGTIFLVNHIGTRVIEPDQPISFFEQEISVTRNLGASRLHDFLFGGLNNHIEHHLFPSMPTARLRAARRITREFLPRARHSLSRNVVAAGGARNHAPFQSDVRPLCRIEDEPMNPNFTAIRALMLTASLLVLGGCAVRQAALNSVGDALAQGGTAFASDDDPELIRAAAPFSLKLMESLLAETPQHKGLLLAASRGFTQYAYAFLQQEAEEAEEHDLARTSALEDRARRLYRRARDYGLRGLALHRPDFERRLRADPRRAIAEMPRRRCRCSTGLRRPGAR